MASSKIEGLNYELNGNEFLIFGYGAEIPEEGSKTFVVQSCLGRAVVGMPEPALPQILEAIEADKSAGNLDRIKYVLMNAHHAGFMLLERSLTVQQFGGAEETELFHGKFGQCIVLQPVQLGDYSFPIIIVDHDDKKAYPVYATLDETGDIV